MVPADESAPRMKLTGTRGRSPALQELVGGADLRQVDPGPRASLEDHALLGVPVEDGVHRVVDRQDETRRPLLGHPGHPDVEPHRRVERRHLVDDHVLELVTEDLRLVVLGEVAVLDPPRRDGVDHPVGHLAQRELAFGGVGGPPEVLLGQDVGGIEAPTLRHLDVQLLEGHVAVPVVGDPGIAAFPDDLVIGVDTLGREVTPDSDTDALGGNGHVVDLFLVSLSGGDFGCR